MLLQIELFFITYGACKHAEGPAHLGSLIRFYIVCLDPAEAQADLGVSFSHMSKGQFYLEHL